MSSAQQAKQKIRVLVVDDSAFVRRAIIRMFAESSEIQVIDVASDGSMAIDLVNRLRPDVVTLDVQMPVLDGLTALAGIMKQCPTPVIMLSSLTGKGGENTLRALELGAVDFIDKSVAGGPMDIGSLARELTTKILTAARVDMKKLVGAELVEVPPLTTSTLPAAGGTEIMLIGTSTGGPPALQAILPRLPADFPVPVLVVQHMPVGFTSSLAERLDRTSPLRVKEAEDGEPLHAGTVYIAPGGWHLKVKRRSTGLHALLDGCPEDALHKPSVDVLLESAASVCGKGCLAFILTGMGRDGVLGAQAVKSVGGRVVVEAEESAIVFGMPKAVMESVTVDRIVLLSRVAETALELV